MRFIGLLIFSLLLSFKTFAGKVDSQFHVEGYGQLRELNQNGFLNRESQYEGYLLIDYLYSWVEKDLFFEIKPQLRGLQSPGVQDNGPQMVSIKPSKRWLKTQTLITKNSEQEIYIDFDRLNLRYKVFKNGEIFVGRRPLSFGVLRLFPVINKLTLPLIFRPGPQWIDNPDAAGFTTSISENGSLRLLAVGGEEARADSIYLAELKQAFDAYEFHLLAANWWERNTLATAFSADFFDTTWRFEAIRFSERREEKAVLQWSAGFEHAINGKLNFVFEYFQQTNCNKDNGSYGIETFSRFQVLNGCKYVFPYLDWQMSDLWRSGIGILANIDDPSFMNILNLEYSWTDNLSFEFQGKIPVGKNGSEFGKARFTDPLGRDLGVQTTLYLGLLYTQ